MHRFYIPSQNISADKIIISDKKQVHYIKDVLRLKPKDEILVFDDKGNQYSCIIEKVLDRITLNVKDRHPASAEEKRIKITVACAIPKGPKMDDVMDKLTQLGVDRIIPLETARVIVRLDKHKKILRQKRWEKIALSASQQSQRSQLPTVDSIKDIKEILSESEGFDLKLIPTLTGERKFLKEALDEFKPKNILVLIGPEGDFTSEEVDLAIQSGCIPVSLGDLVLRVDTAAIAIASFIRLYADS